MYSHFFSMSRGRFTRAGSAQPARRTLRLLTSMLTVVLVTTMMSACSSRVVKTTDVVPVMQERTELAENLLLDVGVTLFNPGIEESLAEEDEDQLVFSEIRRAEARYFPHILVNTLQTSAAWGAVRIVPTEQSAVDVVVEGTIVHSDGEILILEIKVSDSSGRQWYNQRYEGIASRYSYDGRRNLESEPFQTIYNQIANDLLIHRRTLDSARIAKLRTLSELKFAQSFAPETFAGHISKDKTGEYQIDRLPADNDPMIIRIRQIRERDFLFIDTLQEYFNVFARQLRDPYQNWRKESYNEVIALKSLERSGRDRIVAGAAAILAGIFAAGNSSAVTRATGSVAMAGGAYVVKGGVDKYSESKIHIEALQELGDSLGTMIAPQVIELEDRTVTLSGTVDSQYRQWRAMLQQIYQIDRGIEVDQ